VGGCGAAPLGNFSSFDVALYVLNGVYGIIWDSEWQPQITIRECFFTSCDGRVSFSPRLWPPVESAWWLYFWVGGKLYSGLRFCQFQVRGGGMDQV